MTTQTHTFTLGAWSPDRAATGTRRQRAASRKSRSGVRLVRSRRPDINGNPVRIVGGQKIERALRPLRQVPQAGQPTDR